MTTGNVYVVAYEANVGMADSNSPWPMFWQSSYTTNDGTLIEWGTGDHNQFGDNGVREFDPLTRSQSYVYPSNNGTRDVQQYDNQQYWYIPRIDSLVVPGRGQYSRASRSWVRGESATFWPNGPHVVGTGANDLIRPDASVSLYQFQGDYNGHQAWSKDHDCGVIISGGPGGDNTAQQKMWIVVPSSGLGSFPQPYYVTERALPASVGGVSPAKLVGRDGCCFLGDYVYWVGGGDTVTVRPTPHFFRMRIVDHLRSKTATMAVERLPDAPAAFNYGLLRADPTISALLCVTDSGIFVYDVVANAWIVVTPAAYTADFASGPSKGLLPYGSLGDFVDARAGQSVRKFIFRTGINHAWDYPYSTTDLNRMYRQYRAIQLSRR